MRDRAEKFIFGTGTPENQKPSNLKTPSAICTVDIALEYARILVTYGLTLGFMANEDAEGFHHKFIPRH